MAGSSSTSDYLTPDGQYRVDGSEMGLLGSGAHGVVRVAQHVHTMEYVAVKITPTSVVTSSCKEMMALSRLNSPHIVQLIGVQVDMHEQKVYVIMELCQGGELFDRIAECGGLEEADARRYFVQILLALRHCHQNRIYHRDLKPENILLDEEDNAKVADFGLAAVFKDVRSDASFLQHTKVGSVMYAAPEVLTSTASTGYDASCADMWSLGIILFSMLSGTLPFECAAASRCKRYAAVLQQGIQVMCPEHLSEHVSLLLSRLLHPDPRQRFTPEQALNCDWVRESEQNLLANTAVALRDHEEVNAATVESRRSWKIIFHLAHDQLQPQGQQQGEGQQQQLPARPQQQGEIHPPSQQPQLLTPEERQQQASQQHKQQVAQEERPLLQARLGQEIAPPPKPDTPPQAHLRVKIASPARDSAAGAPSSNPADTPSALTDADTRARALLKRAADGGDADTTQQLRQRTNDGTALPQLTPERAPSPAAPSLQPLLVGSSSDEDIIPTRGTLFDHVTRWGWGSLPKGTEALLRDILSTLCAAQPLHSSGVLLAAVMRPCPST